MFSAYLSICHAAAHRTAAQVGRSEGPVAGRMRADARRSGIRRLARLALELIGLRPTDAPR
jgi:hypothetical protein